MPGKLLFEAKVFLGLAFTWKFKCDFKNFFPILRSERTYFLESFSVCQLWILANVSYFERWLSRYVWTSDVTLYIQKNVLSTILHTVVS